MHTSQGAAQPSAQVAARWPRWPLLAVVLLAVIVAGCIFGHADVVFTFDNRTDAALCQYASPEGVAAARCLENIEPQQEADIGNDCDGVDDRPISVFIAVKQDGRQIFERTETCADWHDTDRTFVIEQEDGEFIVTGPDGAPGSVDR